MGACLSCLGLSGLLSEDPSETSRLLSDDQLLPSHYGTQHPSGHGAGGANGGSPLDLQRETEALRRIVARTSDNLIDIFSLPAAPPANTTTTATITTTTTTTTTPTNPSHPPSSSQSRSPQLLPQHHHTQQPVPNTHYHPPPNHHTASKTRSYRLLLQKTSPPPLPELPQPLPADAVSEEERAWLVGLGKEAEKVVCGIREVKRGSVGELVGGFAGLEPGRRR